ncbi:Sulfhydryl oxidase 2, partial [Globisporangium splendens]
MHHDVFRSYRYLPCSGLRSWSVNITGRKEWIFFHPDEEWKLKDRFGRYVIPDVTMEDIDRTQFPHVHEATPIYVTQEAGEAIFVPSGWYHQVKNVEATISINHNWFNGYNLDQIWQFFQRECGAVENELEDLKELGLVGREFKDQCQVVMKANTGINYAEFRTMLYSKAHELLTMRWKQRDIEVSQQMTASDQDLLVHLSTLSRVLSELAAYLQDEEAPAPQLKFAELMQANDAYREENEQWRVAYEQLETSKRELEEQWDAEKKELEEKVVQLEEKVVQLEESVKSYTSELVSDLEELEKEKVSHQSNEEMVAEPQKQINESNERFRQLTSEYNTLHTAFHLTQSEKQDLEQRRSDLETQSQQQSQQLQDSQAEIAALKKQLSLQAISHDKQVNEQAQDAQLRQSEQQVVEKEEVIAQLNQQVRRLEEEVSSLSLTCGGSAKPGPAAAGTLRDLQQQIFHKSEELVAQGEKNMVLAEKHEQLRIQWQELRNEVRDVRLVLLKGIAGSDVDGSLYQHVRLDELVRLRLKALEHEWLLSGVSGTPSDSSSIGGAETETEDGNGGGGGEKEQSVHLASVGSFSALDGLGSIGRLERELRLCRSRNKRLQDQCEYLERELQTAMNGRNEFEGLKVKMVDVVSRERVEKELRQKCEANYKESSEKIVALSEHIEKLMVHLKHEAAAKTKAMDAQRRLEKELTECKEKSVMLQKKNTVKDQQIQELEQGAKILEDQLRLMDEKFIDVRNKLDWTRATSQKEVKKLNSELSALRMKWQLASDAGVLNSLPDWTSVAKMSKKSKPLGASSSDGNFRARTLVSQPTTIMGCTRRMAVALHLA